MTRTEVSSVKSVPTPSGSVVNELACGASAAVGTATTYARGDHTHGTFACPVKNKVGKTSGVVYQNTNTTYLLVMISIFLADNVTNDGTSFAIFKSDASNPPVTENGAASFGSSGTFVYDGTIVAVIKPNEFYELTFIFSGSATGGVNDWVEVQLF